MLVVCEYGIGVTAEVVATLDTEVFFSIELEVQAVCDEDGDDTDDNSSCTEFDIEIEHACIELHQIIYQSSSLR